MSVNLVLFDSEAWPLSFVVYVFISFIYNTALALEYEHNQHALVLTELGCLGD